MMTENTPDILKKILARKAEEINERKLNITEKTLQQRAKDSGPTRGFNRAIQETLSKGKPAVIAEIKKASPSAGIICQNFNPEFIAQSYEEAGASCLSVLTDIDFFCGADLHLQQVRATSSIPILRKDFIITPYQVYESRVLGADCILIIASVLSDIQMQDLTGIATELDLDVIVEIHNREELEHGLMLRTPLIGINNRNLHTFETDIQTTIDLLPDVLYDRTVITESGIHTNEHVKLLRKHNANAFLVGEVFMRHSSPGKLLRQLFF